MYDMEVTMEYKRSANDVIARLDKGDKIMASINEIAEKESIKAGFVSGIGAVNQAKLSFFLLGSNEYNTVNFEEPFEVLSMNGTLSYVDDSPHQHVHIVLGREDYSTIGGHLQEATVSVTLEVHIKILDTEVTRETSSEFGIQTLDLS